MYQALYRKWRPRTFSDVAGQEHITETLKRQIETGRLSHAYLFVGTRGTGKTSCAKILARAVNCLHPVNGEPCNECAACVGIENGSILDVVELDAASNNGVDNVRALREEAVYSPAAVKKRVYIVDEVHMLSGAAFNALLKILEEPPEHLMFILATTELHKVPATILSRCQRFSFRRLSREAVAGRLSYVAGQEGFDLTPGAAELLARLADGSMRDGLSLLDQCRTDGPVDEERVMNVVGLAGARETAELFSRVRDGDAAGALEIVDRLYSSGRDMEALLDELSRLVRDILVMKLTGTKGQGLLSGAFDSAALRGFEKMSVPRLLRCAEIVAGAAVELGRTSGRRTAVELCVVRLCGNEPAGGELEARVDRLETLVERCGKLMGVPREKKEKEPDPDPEPVRETAPEPEEQRTPESPALEPEAPAAPEQGAPAVSEAPAEPEASAEPEVPTEPEASADTEGFWDRMLARLRETLDIPTYAFLSDRTDITAELSGDSLKLTCKSVFTPNAISAPEVLDAIRKTAKEVLGLDVSVRVVTEEATEGEKRARLDSLSRFGNVEFR